jgi:hypothetical protein
MRFFFFIVCIIVVPQGAQAYVAEVAEPQAEYAAIAITDDTYKQRTYLGDLEGAPDMYTFTTDVAISIQLQLAQHDNKDAVPFGIIMVRQNDDDGGVTEILRQNQPLEEWTEDHSSFFGFSRRIGGVIEKEILPGTYNIEISTPDNQGVYLLTLGDEPVRTGYFRTVYEIMETQVHLGLVPLRIFLTPFGYIPLLIVLGGGAWWYRRRLMTYA